MNKINYYWIVPITLLFLSGCSDDDHTPKGQFESGTFVVNEGNFTDADGTVSFISASNEVTNDLFGSVNNGRALGDVVQSMTVAGDLAYIVVNNSNKIEVVNANTFEAIHTISGLKLPRYFATLNGKGYATEWVSYTDPGRVSIIDLQTHAVTGTITTDYGAENIIEVNGKLFVSNSFTNTVSVIDPAASEVAATIEVANSPGDLAVDAQNKLWVICGGGYDAGFNPLNDGALVQIDPATHTVAKTIALNTNLTAKLAIDKARTHLFYYKGKSVYKITTSDTAPATSPLFTETAASSFYGIEVDPETDVLYLADAQGFALNGTVFLYSTDGTPKQTLSVGRGPNGFVFK